MLNLKAELKLFVWLRFIIIVLYLDGNPQTNEMGKNIYLLWKKKEEAK